MLNRRQFVLGAITGIAGAVAAPRRLSAADPATRTATARLIPDVPADVVWHDVREWGVEGRGFDDTTAYFDRLPGRAKGVVREAVWNLSHDTSGMVAGFETDGVEIYVRYELTKQALAMPHMPATGVSGVDLYGMAEGTWRWVGTCQPRSKQVEAKLVGDLAPGRRAYRLNLPLYNGVSSLEVGVRRGAAFEGVKPRREGAIVFYGTSITQGGCASRPGMSFTSILGRRLDRPVLNFGFSGNGTTEVEVARFLAELTPAVFVLDTVANTPVGQLKARTEAVVKLLKKERPGTAVVLLGGRVFANSPLVPGLATGAKAQAVSLLGAYNELLAAGVTGLHYQGGEDLIGSDGEATVDGSHPTDLGMVRYADAVEGVLRKALGA